MYHKAEWTQSIFYVLTAGKSISYSEWCSTGANEVVRSSQLCTVSIWITGRVITILCGGQEDTSCHFIFTVITEKMILTPALNGPPSDINRFISICGFKPCAEIKIFSPSSIMVTVARLPATQRSSELVTTT